MGYVWVLSQNWVEIQELNQYRTSTEWNCLHWNWSDLFLVQNESESYRYFQEAVTVNGKWKSPNQVKGICVIVSENVKVTDREGE